MPETREGTEEVRKRASLLFESVFDPKDACVILAQDWPGDDDPCLTRLSLLFTFAQRHLIGVGAPHGKAELPNPVETEIASSILTWITLPSRSFSYDCRV